MPAVIRADAGSIGPALARARRSAGLTQAELATRIGTTQASITRLERGRFLPSVRTLRRIAAALDLTFAIGGAGGHEARSGPRSAPTLDEVRAHRAEIVAIAAAEGADDVRVFGSVARGDARPESDVDFLVVLGPDCSLLNLSGLHLRLEEVLGRPVHISTLLEHTSSERERRVSERIRNEAVRL